MKKLYCYCICACVTFSIFSYDCVYVDIEQQINEYSIDFYSGTKLIEPIVLHNLVNDIEINNQICKNEKLSLILDCYTLLAKIVIPVGKYAEYYPILKDFSKKVQTKDFLSGKLSSDVYASYSDFIFSLIPLAKATEDGFPYNWVVDSKSYAKLAVLKDSTDIKARTLYGIAGIASIDFPSNQQYLKTNTFLENTEGLSEYLVFRVHLYRSMAHMKVNNITKSFEELEIAKNIYPNSPYIYMLEKAYKNKRTCFDKTDLVQIENYFIFYDEQ